MHNVYRLVWVWLLLFCSVMAGENFIVLSYGNHDAMMEQRTKYETYVDKHPSEHAKAQIEHIADTYMLQVGPYARNDALALSFMRMKETFPNAVIIEKKASVVMPKTVIKPVEKKVYIVNPEKPKHLPEIGTLEAYLFQGGVWVFQG